MLKLRGALTAFLLAIVMVFASVASAQELDPCFGLAQADCDVINAATANTLASVTSFNQTWTIDVSITGVPDGGDVVVNISGSGPVVIDPAAAIPFSFDQAVSVSIAGAPFGDTGAILKDGVLYVLTAPDTWQSLDLSNPEMLAGALPVNPMDLAGGATTDPAAQEAAMSALPAVMGLVSNPALYSYVREGDNFTWTMDLGQLLADPAFAETLEGLSALAGEQGVMLSSMGPMLGMLISEGKITVVQSVDSAANVVTGLDFWVDATVNAGMLAGDPAMAPIVISIKFAVDLSDANGTFDITAPANATPLDMSGMGM